MNRCLYCVSPQSGTILGFPSGKFPIPISGGFSQVFGFMDEPMTDYITPFLIFFSIIPLFLQAVSRYMSIVHDARYRDRHF